MTKGETNPGRIYVRGDALMDKLPATTRKRRKRKVSKIRRTKLKRNDSSESPEC